MREYHIDCDQDLLMEFVDEDKRSFRSNLSVRFPTDADGNRTRRPIIILGQDESIFSQFAYSKRGWGVDGEQVLRKKTQGAQDHCSDFVSDVIDINPDLRPHLIHINALRGPGRSYLLLNAAMVVNGEIQKPVKTEKHLEDTLCKSPLHYCIQIGQDHDGYWNGNRMTLRFEDVVDCLKVMDSGHDFVYKGA